MYVFDFVSFFILNTCIESASTCPYCMPTSSALVLINAPYFFIIFDLSIAKFIILTTYYISEIL